MRHFLNKKPEGGDDIGTFYPIRPECQADAPKPRFKPRAGKTLSSRRWHAAFSGDGHLDIAKVLRRIQRGDNFSAKDTVVMMLIQAIHLGVHPTIKGLVWEFLLGCYDPNSTFEERNQLRQNRREQYCRWKADCQNMVPVIGSGKFITTPIITDDGQPIMDSSRNNDHGGHVWMLFAQIEHLSSMRVSLTRQNFGMFLQFMHGSIMTLVMYKVNSSELYDCTTQSNCYAVYIACAGMNDICSPMVILLENEADAFWCFDHAMQKLRENFRCSASSMGVQTQLGTLSQVIKTVDPKLHQHLEELDGGEYLFAFRMLMVLFRREFTFADALYLWELMWAMEYNPSIFSSYEEPISAADKGLPILNDKLLKQCGKFEKNNVKTGYSDNSPLAVFLVASVLEARNKQILKEARGLDDVVQILGDITGSLDAKKVCEGALKIHKKYLSKAKMA
ncbi:rab GTPase-activating protein 22 isoform X2 [Ricinus communis]|uniref:rab GTPase-activating protein 22 isoform X2 n=1 Tax=Ricinus communis TaxID=3988 RepID=UPI00201ADA99|nr:rab GTPase-activating protein 22 isoform X2 [Ricinus communis]